MMSFEKTMVSTTVDKLIKGEDYREEVVSAINVSFLEFTLAIASINTNRKFIGIELDENYFKIAEDRIHKALSEKENM